MSVVCCPNPQDMFLNVSKVLPVRLLMQFGWVAAVVVGMGSVSAIAPLSTQAQTVPQTQSGTIEIAQTSAPSSANLLFVNPTLGNDSNNGSSQQNALRTITQALQNAQPNTVILLAPGTYSAESGETFPLALKPGVTIQGEPGARGRGIVIRGGGTFLSRTSASQNVTILGEDEATLVGVTVTNPNPRGYGLWIESSSPTVNNNTFTGSSHDGISVTGNSAPVIRSNAFIQNGANGITVYGTSRPEIRDNVFERTGFGINITENAAPLIVGNQIRQNQDGVVVQENARPTLRDNIIEANQRDGLVAIAQSFPDLGTADEPGNNQFRDNTRQDVNASATSQTIPAFGNQMAGDRTTGRVDLTGVATAPPSRPAPVAQRPFPAPSAIPPTASSPPTSASPTTSATAPVSQPSPSPVAVRPATPSSSEAGFSALPNLEAAPEGTSAQPSVSRPPVPQAQSPQSSVASAPVSVPAPAAIRPNVTISPRDAANAVEIPVLPPSTQATPTPRNQPLARPQPPAQSQPPARTTAANTPAEDAPIEIPVPLPSSTSTPAPAAQPMREVVVSRPPARSPGAPSSRTATATSFAPIEIPVPPPASGTPTPSQVPAAPRAANPVRSTNLLPVPSGNIPVGNIGSLPTISVANSSYNRTSSLGSGSYSGGAAYVRYRVLVEADSESLQAEVRSLVPGAFRTYANGRTMMQAGAFGDRSLADEAAQMLNRSGFEAMVQPVD
jgi:parallel beta-helix repeat protein